MLDPVTFRIVYDNLSTKVAYHVAKLEGAIARTRRMPANRTLVTNLTTAEYIIRA